MPLESFLGFIGGLGLFLYGMKLMSDSLADFAGNEMKNRLQKATDTPLKGVLLGAGVTGVIQSSTATTLMSMGLVSAGTMNIYEALPVIMGANIGTTVTGQLLSLADISKEGLLLSVLKPSFFSPFCILIGAVQLIFFKKKETHQNAAVFIGLGILFSGMQTMENSLKPLAELPQFHKLFLIFQNPVIAILLGAAITAVLQSSSLSIGILQTLSATNAISFSSAVPIILGMNIGKCLPELVASLSTNKNTKRTIFADLLVNIIGVAIVFIPVYCIEYIFGLPFWDNKATKSMIAMFHTAFNVVSTFALLPFYKKIIAVSKRIIK